MLGIDIRKTKRKGVVFQADCRPLRTQLNAHVHTCMHTHTHTHTHTQNTAIPKSQYFFSFVVCFLIKMGAPVQFLIFDLLLLPLLKYILKTENFHLRKKYFIVKLSLNT